ncbi:hypothetical protein F4779DRAFT_623593 [Xylariaceae sp. FL0662B]|nr:hypothetical protein F4779DRAFT_623593 [Xylariaceae sp. FL0662B]
MDALKKFASGHKSGDANNAQQGQGTQNKDIGDKIAGFVNKREGNKFSDQQLESTTDRARNLYEKATGKKVDPKISN